MSRDWRSTDGGVSSHGKNPRVACVTNTSFSGFTIFCLLANSHSQVVALGDGLNPRILRARGESFVCSCGAPLKDCSFWQAIFDSVNSQGVAFALRDCNLNYSFLHPVWDRLIGRYHDDIARAAIRKLAVKVWPPYRRHVALHTARNVAFARAVTQSTKKDVYVHNGKPLMSLYYLRDSVELDVVVINMVRDARGFVNSAVKRGASAEEASLRWRRYHTRVAALTRAIDGRRKLMLKYEDLCGNTVDTMRGVFRFLGVEERFVSSRIVPAEHHIAGNDLRLKKELTVALDDDWQTKLSRSDLGIIEKNCRTLCEQMGYEW